MLGYRFDHLEAAAKNARLLGRRGLQFPWESASSTGQEASPLPGTAAWHEDHISLDIALTFAFHANVTGDERFLRERAWPVLAGVAEWLESRATRTSRGYEILRSMGIAEREQTSDNSAFTNMAAKVVLRKAVEIGKRVELPIRELWCEMAETLVLPERGGAIMAQSQPAFPAYGPRGDGLRQEVWVLKPRNPGVLRDISGETARAETSWRWRKSRANSSLSQAPISLNQKSTGNLTDSDLGCPLVQFSRMPAVRRIWLQSPADASRELSHDNAAWNTVRRWTPGSLSGRLLRVRMGA